MKNDRHVQLPNNMTLNDNLTPKDLVIYLAIKRHLNGTNGQCNPSLPTICDESGASVNTVRKCIKNLTDAGYISTTRLPKGVNYTFSPYKNFEPFSYEFLDNKDLTFTEKAYLIASQQFMFIDGENCGKISYTNMELSSKLNMSYKTIARCDQSLQKKNLLTIIDTHAKDVVTGCNRREKIFALEQFGQAVAYALKNHEDRIQENTNDIQDLKEENRKLKESYSKDMEIMRKQIETLQKQLNLNLDYTL